MNGVKTVLNNIEVTGSGATASTTTPQPAPPAPQTTPPAPPATPPTPASATPSVPVASPLEVTGTVVSVDPTSGTITLQDGRVVRTTDQTLVWQPSSVGALKPGAQVLMRGAAPAAYQAGTSSTARNWRMATVSRVDRASNELMLSDGSVVKLTPSTNVHRGGNRVTIDQLEPGSEVVVYTPSASSTEASEVAVVWTPTASVR